jgi:carbon monoxide dehydrogenase subunit G
MDMQGSRTLSADRQQAWDALNDPEVLKACIPGCDRIEEQGPGQYAIGMSVKIGPVAARFAGKIQLQDVQPPSSYTLKFEGQGGAAGFGKGQAQVRLEPREPGCELFYTANAQVGGKIAQVGQRLIDGVARSMAEDFFKRFEQELQRRHPAPQVEAAPPSAPGNGKGDAMARTGQAEVGSHGVPAWFWAVALVVLTAIAYWLTR